MLEAGPRQGRRRALTWHEGDAENLPVDDAVADAHIISFGIRNCTDVPAVLREAQARAEARRAASSAWSSRASPWAGSSLVCDFYSLTRSRRWEVARE